MDGYWFFRNTSNLEIVQLFEFWSCMLSHLKKVKIYCSNERINVLFSFVLFCFVCNDAGVTGRSSSKSYSVKDETSNEIMAVIKLDNVTVAQTNWKPCSQQAWDQRFSIDLDKSREVEIDIYWRDWRSLCGVKFLRLEEFIDDVRHGMALQLEPQGLLFAEIKFLNPMISRKPKLQRQRRIFKQQGTKLFVTLFPSSLKTSK